MISSRNTHATPATLTFYAKQSTASPAKTLPAGGNQPDTTTTTHSETQTTRSNRGRNLELQRTGLVLERPFAVSLHHDSNRIVRRDFRGQRISDLRMGHGARHRSMRKHRIHHLVVPQKRHLYPANQIISTRSRTHRRRQRHRGTVHHQQPRVTTQRLTVLVSRFLAALQENCVMSTAADGVNSCGSLRQQDVNRREALHGAASS